MCRWPSRHGIWSHPDGGGRGKDWDVSCHQGFRQWAPAAGDGAGIRQHHSQSWKGTPSPAPRLTNAQHARVQRQACAVSRRGPNAHHRGRPFTSQRPPTISCVTSFAFPTGGPGAAAPLCLPERDTFPCPVPRWGTLMARETRDSELKRYLFSIMASSQP